MPGLKPLPSGRGVAVDPRGRRVDSREAEMARKLLRGLTVSAAAIAGLVVVQPGHALAASGHAVTVRPAGGTVTLVSVTSSGRSAGRYSFAVGISAHGRFVAFTSGANEVF